MKLLKFGTFGYGSSKVLDLGSISPKLFFSQESNVKPKSKCWNLKKQRCYNKQSENNRGKESGELFWSSVVKIAILTFSVAGTGNWRDNLRVIFRTKSNI